MTGCRPQRTHSARRSDSVLAHFARYGELGCVVCVDLHAELVAATGNSRAATLALDHVGRSSGSWPTRRYVTSQMLGQEWAAGTTRQQSESPQDRSRNGFRARVSSTRRTPPARACRQLHTARRGRRPTAKTRFLRFLLQEPRPSRSRRLQPHSSHQMAPGPNREPPASCLFAEWPFGTWLFHAFDGYSGRSSKRLTCSNCSARARSSSSVRSRKSFSSGSCARSTNPSER